MSTMKPDEIKRVAASAEAHGLAILEHFLPGGKKQGAEYVVKNPHRNDESAGSFSINLSKGIGKDFASGESFGDFVAVVAFALGCDQGAAADALAKFLGVPGNVQIEKPVRGGVKDEGQCVTPIPDRCPKRPDAHRQSGVPDVVYTYLDADGLISGYVFRYEANEKSTRKKFHSLTLWRCGANLEWRFKAWPTPRPLYGLHLLALHDCPVLIVEGEKSVDHIHPFVSHRFIVLTWPNGSESVKQADFSVLAGRDVVLWPDYLDGEKAMRHVLLAANKAGARSVVTVDTGFLAKTTAGPNGQLIDRFDSLPKGWDAADAVKEGWTRAHFDGLFSNEAAYVSQVADDLPDDGSASSGNQSVSGPYVLNESGVYFIERKGEDGERLVRICSALKVSALCRDKEGGAWSRVCEFKDCDGLPKREMVPARLLVSEGAEAAKFLVDLGLEVVPGRDSLSRLKGYIWSQNPEARARMVGQCGWHGGAYVLPEGAVGDTGEVFLLRDAAHTSGVFAQKGTLADWKEHVSRLAQGNDRLIFALAAALTGPLVKPCEGASVIFHFIGESSHGKSGALYAAASVWGPIESQKGSWRQTSNAAEYVFARHNDGTPILDEIKEVDAKEAGNIVYMACNARGKSRARVDGGLRDSTTWRVVVLSGGEIGLAEQLAQAGQKKYAGHDVRFIEIPSDAGAGLGMWTYLHGVKGGAEFTDAIHRQSLRYYGSAGRAFVGLLVKNLEGVQKRWRQHNQQFSSRLPAGSGGQVQRVLSSFSLVAFAGELATEWGVLPLETGDSIAAAGRLFDTWLGGRATLGNAEEAQIISHVRGIIERGWQSRFVDWHRVTEGGGDPGGDYEAASNGTGGNPVEHSSPPDLSRMAAVRDSLGFRKRDSPFLAERPSFLFYISRKSFEDEFCAGGGFRLKKVSELLKSKGVLKSDKDAATLRIDLPSGEKRAYCITGSALFGLDC